MATVLVVDDDTAQRELVQRILRVAGYTVHSVANGSEALSELERQPYNLLITDIYMPVMDGVELLLHCREQYPGLGLLATTGGSVITDQRKLEAAGLTGVVETVQKPYKVEQLREAVDRALQRG